jgi:oligopeptide transport system ATP-binding protein
MPSSAVAVNGSLLEVRDLSVNFGAFAALAGVSFRLGAGETLGLVGESGSGKSTLARALLRLIPAAHGTVMWRGVDLLSCDSATMRRQRRDLQMIFQDPLGSLNPRMTVGEVLGEPLEIFESSLAAQDRQARIEAMLERVGLARGAAHRYPHEFSGGQCQRIGIARAMMLRPKLLVCDEPVSSLDVSIQGQIVNLLMDLQHEFGTAMLFISHNLAVVRHISHRVLVMYLGRIVEDAARDALFAAPAHPYTRALLAAVPDSVASAPAGAPRVAQENLTAAGEPPAGNAVPSGCAFRNRCRYAEGICEREIPQLEQASDQHAVACHRWRALA